MWQVDKSMWLKHMLLAPDAESDPKGIEVRNVHGLEGVDYLERGAITTATTWVFGKVIDYLLKRGYDRRNLKAVPYDWRVPPQILEKRDKYFSKVVQLIEQTVQQNSGKPVVLMAHSMGNKMAHYFLNWVVINAKRFTPPLMGGNGMKWIDRYVHAFFAVGGPFLGSSQAYRGSLTGIDMGLGTFLNHSEVLTLSRNYGSSPWLMPTNALAAPVPVNVVNLRNECTVTVEIVHVTASSHIEDGWMQLKYQNKKTNHRVQAHTALVSSVDGKGKTLRFGQRFQFVSEKPLGQPSEDTIKFVLRGKSWVKATKHSLTGKSRRNSLTRSTTSIGLGSTTSATLGKASLNVAELFSKGGFKPAEDTSPDYFTMREIAYVIRLQAQFRGYRLRKKQYLEVQWLEERGVQNQRTDFWKKQHASRAKIFQWDETQRVQLQPAISHLLQHIDVRDRIKDLRAYSQCFAGCEAIEILRKWMHDEGRSHDMQDVADLCDRMLRLGLFEPAEEAPSIHFDGGYGLYRFSSELYSVGHSPDSGATQTGASSKEGAAAQLTVAPTTPLGQLLIAKSVARRLKLKIDEQRVAAVYSDRRNEEPLSTALSASMDQSDTDTEESSSHISSDELMQHHSVAGFAHADDPVASQRKLRTPPPLPTALQTGGSSPVLTNRMAHSAVEVHDTVLMRDLSNGQQQMMSPADMLRSSESSDRQRVVTPGLTVLKRKQTARPTLELTWEPEPEPEPEPIPEPEPEPMPVPAFTSNAAPSLNKRSRRVSVFRGELAQEPPPQPQAAADLTYPDGCDKRTVRVERKVPLVMNGQHVGDVFVRCMFEFGNLELSHDLGGDHLYEKRDMKQMLTRFGASHVVDKWEQRFLSDPCLPGGTTADPPPCKRVVHVYGTHLDTEVGYAYRHKDGKEVTLAGPKSDGLELDSDLDHHWSDPNYKCKGGMIFETKNTHQSQLAARAAGAGRKVLRDTRKQVCASGDGTVPYVSLRHSATWDGQNGVSAQNIELRGVEHRAILADKKFHHIAGSYLCETLVVYVLRARDLLVKDYFAQSSDPYVSVRLSGGHHHQIPAVTHRTRVITRDLNPVFDEVLVFGVDEDLRDAETLTFTVYDSDVGGLRSEFIGSTQLRVEDIRDSASRALHGWFPLRTDGGQQRLASCSSSSSASRHRSGGALLLHCELESSGQSFQQAGKEAAIRKIMGHQAAREQAQALRMSGSSDL
jgi:hypothetical protein